MAGASEIEWTDATWNPVTGCTIVSPGCTNCYAMRMAARLQAIGLPAYEGVTRRSGRRHVWTGRVNLVRDALSVPLSWRKPRRVFVNSMSDLFQARVPREFIAEIWATMAAASWHSFQILTKRPDRMAEVIHGQHLPVLPNVWLGTSVENLQSVSRIDELRVVPAAVRFISFEPLLGPVGCVELSGVDWAIVGGESGPRARPMKEEWVREIKRQCDIQHVAFFFKQWGGTNKKAAGRNLDGRTWDAFPRPAARSGDRMVGASD